MRSVHDSGSRVHEQLKPRVPTVQDDDIAELCKKYVVAPPDDAPNESEQKGA